MIYLETESNDPAFNLACEEYFITERTEPVLILWQNEPTIVVGRFQNTREEVNEAYAEANHIHVIRRMTGGGAVYHDLGNLCYSFILRDIQPKAADFSIFAQPVVKALQAMGVDAYTSGRNDILVDEKKVSGTAMRLHANSLLFHGTLLFDSDLGVLAQALNVHPLKIASKSTKSVKSAVTNIAPYLTDKTKDVKTFQGLLREQLLTATHCEQRTLTPEERERIEALAQEKYRSWAWNFGENPQYSLRCTRKFPQGLVDVNMDIHQGNIRQISIRGDFMGMDALDKLEDVLTGVKYTAKDIKMALASLDLSRYVGGITPEELISCVMNRDETETLK